MKQLSIAQCSGNPTYWNTSYDKEKYLVDHKSFISSLNILINKEHNDFSSWYWITKLHKKPYTEKNTTSASTFQQSNSLQIWLTFWLLSTREYNYTGTKSINVVVSIKCGYWNTARIFWIDLILFFFHFENCICPKIWLLQIRNNFFWEMYKHV
jgi:hypothetical protein